jgi:hypothetical protein
MSGDFDVGHTLIKKIMNESHIIDCVNKAKNGIEKYRTSLPSSCSLIQAA